MASKGLGLNVFVTGGIGFIGVRKTKHCCSKHRQAVQDSDMQLLAFAGSHTVLSLLEHGCKVTIIDNLDNAFQIAYERMQKLAGDNAKNMKFIKVRVCTSRAMLSAAAQHCRLPCREILDTLMRWTSCLPLKSESSTDGPAVVLQARFVPRLSKCAGLMLSSTLRDARL